MAAGAEGYSSGSEVGLSRSLGDATPRHSPTRRIGRKREREEGAHTSQINKQVIRGGPSDRDTK